MEKNIEKRRMENNVNCPRSLETILYGIKNLFTSKLKVEEMNKENIEKVKNGKDLIILLHGANSNLKSMYYSMKLLETFGVDVVSLGYNHRESINNFSRDIKNKIENLMKKTRSKKLSLIGICLGGLVARYYIEKLEGKENVDKLITIYSPLKPLPSNLIGYKLNKLMGGNPKEYNFALEELKGINSTKRHLFIYSSIDRIIKQEYSVDKNFNQVCLKGGHILMSYNPNILKVVADYIKNPSQQIIDKMDIISNKK